MSPDTNEPKSAGRAPAPAREDFPHWLAIPARWQDQDLYGHVNNVVYYAYFDTVINDYLIRAGGLDTHAGPAIGVCVESQCRFHRELRFPGTVDAGLRVGRLGGSSVRYEIGLFPRGEAQAAASGHFVHVFVDRARRRPTPVPGPLRAALEALRPG